MSVMELIKDDDVEENEGQRLTEKFTKQFINMDHRLAIGQPDH